MTDNKPLKLQVENIHKRFGGNEVLKGVSLSAHAGDVISIIGSSGSGKSTFLRCINMLEKPNQGRINVAGEELALIASPTGELMAKDAKQLQRLRTKLAMVFQHFKLVQNFTVLENVILGAEDGPMLNTSLSKARRVLADLSREYELDVNPDALIEDLSVGHQQRVEILKALYRDASILILDEPTAVLARPEAEQLFRILRGMTKGGLSIIFISHKLHEVMAIADRCVVLRHGRADHLDAVIEKLREAGATVQAVEGGIRVQSAGGATLKARLGEDRPLPVGQAWVNLPTQWLMLYVDDVLLEAGP